ncbi:hypothetical protein SOVF_078860 [Spinacia oleracea]|nr:hypothetical protein SOVF_078860 [Spinacia oleracea]
MSVSVSGVTERVLEMAEEKWRQRKREHEHEDELIEEDGADQTVETFENMWDLTPDTDLLTELPDDYTFETALADLIDNSLQAVWSNGKGERKLIRCASSKSPKSPTHDAFCRIKDCIVTITVQCALLLVACCLYFPRYAGFILWYTVVQCDEISTAGRTTTLVDFQINGISLAEIEGGEVAITHMHSCNGPDFIVDLHFYIEEDKAASTSPSVKPVREGNARLKCVYFPFTEGKESIERILEKLNADGYAINEDYDTFSRISIRRLGRLLPEARWELLPFMKPKQKRGAKVQILKRCCSRVKCFVDTDAGFNPVPSKTDLAPHHSFTKALKDLGGDTLHKEKVVQVSITRGGKQLSLQQLEREYQAWIFQMHSQYDDECNTGDDEAVLLVTADKEALGITADGVEDKDGSVLTVDASGTNLELRNSISLPIIAIDSGKCNPVDDNEWNFQADKLILKMPSTVEVLGPKQCKALDIYGALPTEATVSAGSLPPKEVVAILRPSNFNPGSTDELDQKYIVRENFEMCLDIEFKAGAGQSVKFDPISAKNTTRKEYHGLYVFPVASIPSLFQKAGTYSFSFSLNVRVIADTLDKIRPSYDATLALSQPGYQPFFNIPCQVFPGPPATVKIFSSVPDKGLLLPQQVIADFKLEVPEVCPVGSKLKDIAFEVVNAEGELDLTIDDEVKHGKHHTLSLRLLADLPDDHSARYPFQQGRCVVKSFTLPQTEGSFFIEAFHSVHTELRVKFEVKLSRSTPPTHTESDSSSDLRATEELDCVVPQSSDERSTSVSVSDAEYHSKTKKGFEFQKEKSTPVSVSDAAKHSKTKKGSEFQSSEAPLAQTSNKKSGSNCADSYTPEHAVTLLGPDSQEIEPSSLIDSKFLKESVLEIIENKVDSAAATYNIASQNMYLKDRYPDFMADVVGVVALLSTAPSPMLSRAFPGEVLEHDHQRRFDVRDPTLPDGTTPPGFLGYAVNMIDISVDHIHVKTVAGRGLRETLFYYLFRDLQVYETKEHMKRAFGYIPNSAISLDGGIINKKDTPTVSLGSMYDSTLITEEIIKLCAF